MDITAATLCDFAQVREGLLFVQSGGISRIGHPEGTPPMLQAFLAAVVELNPDEAKQAHELKVKLARNDTAQEVGTMTAAFQAEGAQLFPGENLSIPFVFPLHQVLLTSDGAYDVHLALDGGAPRILTVYIFSGAPPT
jgi:hypothetical protein